MEFVFEKSMIITGISPLVNSTNEYVVMTFINGTWYVKQDIVPTSTYPPIIQNPNRDSTVVITLTDDDDIKKFYACLGKDVHIIKIDMDFIIEFNDTIRNNNIEIITSATNERYAIIDKALESEALVMKLSIS